MQFKKKKKYVIVYGYIYISFRNAIFEKIYVKRCNEYMCMQVVKKKIGLKQREKNFFSTNGEHGQRESRNLRRRGASLLSCSFSGKIPSQIPTRPFVWRFSEGKNLLGIPPRHCFKAKTRKNVFTVKTRVYHWTIFYRYTKYLCKTKENRLYY